MPFAAPARGTRPPIQVACLEARTKTRHLFIDGRPVPLSSKHEVLYETFRNRTGE